MPGKNEVPTFAEYAQNWWDWEKCAYLKDRRKRYELTQAYADTNRKLMRVQLLPYFGKMRLDRITHEEVERWFDYMAENEYKNTYTNTILKTLMTMMNWAVRRKVLTANPMADVELLSNDRKNLKIITPDEFKALFVKDWLRVWENDRITCIANKLSALTGMRTGEVLGLRGEYVFDTHIYLCAQYDRYGYRKTKTKDQHNIPLVPQMVTELQELVAVNGDGFLFSDNGGATPVTRHHLYNGLRKALVNIGIPKDEIKKRGLCLHAWRHFCNTELQKAGLSISQVQAVTGHKTARMTEWYCHFDPSEFGEVPKVQEGLLDDGCKNQEVAIRLVTSQSA
jgi:integrase